MDTNRPPGDRAGARPVPDRRAGVPPEMAVRRGRGRGVPPAPGRPPGMRSHDPVKDTWDARVDLYDVATWEVRSPLDRLAVGIESALSVTRGSVLLAIATVLFLAQMLVVGALVAAEPLLAVLTGLSILPAFAVAGYIWYDDPTPREPFTLLAATFLLSMIFASIAAVVNDTFGGLFELAGAVGIIAFYFLIVGPIEEFVKWFAIRIYAYKSDVFRTVVDGAVYGAVAGLGFAAIENFTYIGIVYLELAPAGSSTQTEYATIIAGMRAFAGPGHVIFSAWAGFYLGLAKFNPENRRPIIVKGLLIAIFIHALYNTLVTTLPLSFIGVLAFIVVYHGFWFALLYRKISAYRSLYKQIGRPARSR